MRKKALLSSAIVIALGLSSTSTMAELPPHDRGPMQLRLELSEEAQELLGRGQLVQGSSFQVAARFDCPPQEQLDHSYELIIRAVGAAIQVTGATTPDSSDSMHTEALRLMVDPATVCPEGSPAVSITVTGESAVAFGVEATLTVRGDQTQGRYGSGLLLAMEPNLMAYQLRGASALVKDQIEQLNTDDELRLRLHNIQRFDPYDLSLQSSYPDDQASMLVDLQTGEPL